MKNELGIQSAQTLTKRLKKCHKVYKKAKGLEKSQDFEKLPLKPQSSKCISRQVVKLYNFAETVHIPVLSNLKEKSHKKSLVIKKYTLYHHFLLSCDNNIILTNYTEKKKTNKPQKFRQR